MKFPAENTNLECNSFDIIEVNKDILPTPHKSTIFIDPLDYGMTFESALAHSLTSIDDTNVDVKRHICKAHFYVASTSLAL